MTSMCAIVAIDTYNVAIEEVPVTTRDPVVASTASRRLQPSYLPGIPASDAFEYPVPIQWLAKPPDANELARRLWLSWPLRLQRWILGFNKSPNALHTLEDIERSELRPGTNVLDHFDVLESAADKSSVLYRFGAGDDPREVDGVMRFTAELEGEDLAVFGLASAMWSPVNPEFPSWIILKLHRVSSLVKYLVLTDEVSDLRKDALDGCRARHAQRPEGPLEVRATLYLLNFLETQHRFKRTELA